MKSYVARRIAYLIPLALALTVFSFGLERLAPGDIATQVARSRLGVPPTKAQTAAVARELALDRPAPVQYVRWLGRVVRGDFGSSFATGSPVGQAIARRLPITAVLALLALAIVVGLSVPIGVASAVFARRPLDHLSRLGSLVASSLPSFLFGYALIVAFALRLHLVQPLWSEGPAAYVLPAFALAVPAVGTLTRLTRACLLGVMGEEYIAAARARGIAEARVLFRQALRPALNPLLTYCGVLVGGLLAGSVIIEKVFGIPGMGSLAVDAVLARDLPVIQGCVLVFGTAAILASLTVDILQAAVDPRIRLGPIGRGRSG